MKLINIIGSVTGQRFIFPLDRFVACYPAGESAPNGRTLFTLVILDGAPNPILLEISADDLVTKIAEAINETRS